MAIDIIARGMIESSKNDISQLFDITKGGEIVSNESSYTLNNAVDYPLLELNLYGKSVQDGTPTPDAPVDIVSVGDSGSVAISVDNGDSVSISANITSALPLCGIPVNSYGNYKDSTGQQWACDELIYNADGTGKIVKRTAAYTITEGTNVGFMANSGSYQRAVIDFAHSNIIAPKDGVAICSSYRYNTYFRFVSATQSIDDYAGCFGVVNGGTGNINMRFATTATTAEQFVSENLGVKIIYQRAEPQEIELTAAEMAQLRALQTFNGITNITNGSSADMDVKICTNKLLAEYVNPITTGLQKQIDELKAAVLSLGGNV